MGNMVQKYHVCLGIVQAACYCIAFMVGDKVRRKIFDWQCDAVHFLAGDIVINN
jgi:hypothetical protein